jgi:phenylacetate-CoA ligase
MQKLRAQLAYAAEWIPLYQEKFRSVGFEPGDLKHPEDLSGIPSLKRADLVEHCHRLVDRRWLQAALAADGRPTKALGKPIACAPFRQHRLVKHTSSGSTGEPVAYYEDGSTSAASWAFEQFFKSWFGIRPGPREVRMMRLATEHMPTNTTQRLRQLLWRQIVLPGINLTDNDYAASYATLTDYQPHVLWGFTSALRGLAEYMVEQSKRLNYRPELVITWAEPMRDYEEEILGEAFQCPTTNLYSSHEVGHIACRCPAGGFHIDQNALFVEVDRQKGHNSDDGAGEFVITTLSPSPMPFIRYRMGDVGTLSNTSCSCGRNLQVIESLVGRTYELFTTRDGRMISPNFWLHLFRRDVASFIQRFQIIYKKDGNILAKIVRKPEHETPDDAAIRQLLDRNFSGQTQVDWVYVDDITPEPSGKVPIVRFESARDERVNAPVT